MVDNHRRFERRTLPVRFQGRNAHGAGTLVFESADLSAGGTFLKSDVLFEPGDCFSLEYSVPGVPRVLRAEARVAWVRRFPRGEEPPGMGVEFQSMSENDAQLLKRFLAPG